MTTLQNSEDHTYIPKQTNKPRGARGGNATAKLYTVYTNVEWGGSRGISSRKRTNSRIYEEEKWIRQTSACAHTQEFKRFWHNWKMREESIEFGVHRVSVQTHSYYYVLEKENEENKTAVTHTLFFTQHYTHTIISCCCCWRTLFYVYICIYCETVHLIVK